MNDTTIKAETTVKLTLQDKTFVLTQLDAQNLFWALRNALNIPFYHYPSYSGLGYGHITTLNGGTTTHQASLNGINISNGTNYVGASTTSGLPPTLN